MGTRRLHLLTTCVAAIKLYDWLTSCTTPIMKRWRRLRALRRGDALCRVLSPQEQRMLMIGVSAWQRRSEPAAVSRIDGRWEVEDEDAALSPGGL